MPDVYDCLMYVIAYVYDCLTVHDCITYIIAYDYVFKCCILLSVYFLSGAPTSITSFFRSFVRLLPVFKKPLSQLIWVRSLPNLIFRLSRSHWNTSTIKFCQPSWIFGHLWFLLHDHISVILSQIDAKFKLKHGMPQ